jgi:2-hydroxychromene-2-carboxylate isomerase
VPERIEFWFDFLSPYAYLARHRLEQIAARFRAEIDYRPLDLPRARTSAAGAQPPPTSPAKFRYVMADLARWSARYGIPLVMPASRDTERLHLATLYAARRGQAGEFVREAFHLTWGLGRDPRDEAVLDALATTLGWDARELRSWLGSGEARAQFEKNNLEAQERGVFGVPTVCVRDQLWWGNDRLDFVEEYLAGLARGGRRPASDERVALGAAIFGFVEPHRGAEAAFNRWYERDHLVAAGAMAPWTMATQRWVATRELKALRYPADSPIARPKERGSYLSAIWIQADRFDDQQAWVAEQMKMLAAMDRNFDRRDVVGTVGYDYRGGAFRDPDGVPPEQALDHRYPGIVLAWLERAADVRMPEFEKWLVEQQLPALIKGTPLAMALAFAPKPKASWWPKAAPEVPGIGERLLVSFFTERDPRECWAAFAGLGAALTASRKGRALLVAPFIPVVPGTDRYSDELGDLGQSGR